MSHSAHLGQAGRQLRTLGITRYWHEYRPGISAQVAELLVEAAGRDGDAETLLDLGTGSGQVVRALHPHFRDIIAVDPLKDLIDVAERDLRRVVAPGTRLRLVESTAESFEPPEGWTASLVTMCRSFHWMDQPLVLDHLAATVPASGVVAIMMDRGFWRTPAPWKQAVEDVIHDFLGTERDPGRDGFSHRDQRHRDALAASAFTEVDEVVVPVRRTWTSASILGYLYSRSITARPLFGERVDEFERAIRQVLADHSDGDAFAEDDEFVVSLGRKPRTAR